MDALCGGGGNEANPVFAGAAWVVVVVETGVGVGMGVGGEEKLAP